MTQHAPELVIVRGENRGAFVQLRDAPVTIGRSSRADLQLEDTKASSIHAKVTALESGMVLLQDLQSTNGTFVNKERVEQIPLRSGDLIKIGRTLIVFRDEPAQVRLEDIELVGGGSSSAIAGEAARATTSSAALHAVREAAPMRGAAPSLLEAMFEAAGELDPQDAVGGILERVRVAAAGDRALLFLRRPLTGGLGLGQASLGEGAVREAPVIPDLLRRALGGEVVTEGSALAAPVLALGRTLGAIYVDGSEAASRDLAAVCCGAQLVGLVSGLGRSQELILAATEIVGLAQEQVQQLAIPLEHVVESRRAARQSQRFQAGTQPLETALLPDLWVYADANLLARGLDRLVDYARGVARGPLRLVGDLRGETVRLLLRFEVGDRPPEDLLDSGGVVGDLLRAREDFQGGQLAVARVAVLRAGARFTASAEGRDLVFLLELRAAPKP
ncbi:MAG: FHA domain-containing protein [Planctomycetota bacterium]